MGTRPGERHSFLAQGDGGQPGLAFGQNPEQACLRGWQRNRYLQLSKAPTAQRRGESDDRKSVEGAERSPDEKTVQRATLDRRPAVGAGERAARIRTDSKHESCRRARSIEGI